MLHKDPFIIAPHTFELTQRLQSFPQLQNFYLVGGTSLALQIGDMNSIDIDLFTRDEFDIMELASFLSNHFHFTTSYTNKNTLLTQIDNVKVDFVRHDYPYVLAPIVEEGITFLSKEDIAAVKLNAISTSGKRLKDFIDVYYLLEYFSIDEMISFYVKKYPFYNPLIALKSINYFDDLDLNIDPPKLRKEIPLEEMKNRINDAVLNSRKVFN